MTATILNMKGQALGFDAEKAREDFPILARDVYGKRLVYLDSGASAQKPAAVLDAMRDFAVSEYASEAVCVPKPETVCALHNLRKSQFRQRFSDCEAIKLFS